MLEKKIPLRIIKKLPQIVLPSDKIEMFLKWYDTDLRFQDEIPKAFERGYILSNLTFCLESENFNFKQMAQHFNTTYRIMENLFNDFISILHNTVIYFKFQDMFLNLEIYCNSELISTLQVDMIHTDKSKPNPLIKEKIVLLKDDTNKGFADVLAYYCFILTQCCLWYMATTSKTTKYYREHKQEPFYYEKKEIINVKRNRFITTPIYDMSKIKRVKLDSLIKRRKGWTYSHSFQVCGHYRHYKDGKIIFINSYIKGKGKEEMPQIITLNPKEE